jgi:urea transport system permease protein
VVDTFMVVVVGGVGKLVGSIVAALVIGTANYLIGSGVLVTSIPTPLLTTEPFKSLADLLTFFSSTSMAKVIVFALIIVFLQVRPGGIFPQKGRTVDA